MKKIVKKTDILKFRFIIYIIFGLYVLYTGYIYLSVFISAKKSSENENSELLRIKIYGSSTSEDGNTISGTFSIIDSNGNEIAVIERSWNGSYLNVDFSQCKWGGKYFTFPKKIYAKNGIFDFRNSNKRGTELSKYYNENSQCMILGYGSSAQKRRALYRIAKFTLRKYLVIDFFKRTKNVSIDLSDCKTGRYYSIKAMGDGRIIIEEI